MSKLKVAVIGLGTISRRHLEAYQNNPDVELYALCDINEDRLKEAGKKYGVERLYTSCEEMVKLPELDAVSICTWNSAHAPCAIAALNAGKHVLCEKPMANTLEDALKMQEAAEKSGKLLMIAFVRRFGNDMKLIKDFQESGYFGDIYYAKAGLLRRNGNPMGWFGDKSRSGGGPLIDLGVHVIDFVRYAMGNPKPISVYASTYQKLFARTNIKTPKGYVSASATDNDICDVEDLASAMIRFDNGATLHVETSYSLNIEEGQGGGIQLFGTKAGAKVDKKLKLITEANNYLANLEIEEGISLDFELIFQNEINHFVDSIQGKVNCISPAQDGIEIMKILSAAYKSAETGHEVVLG